MPAGVALQVQQLGAVARPLSVALLTFAVVVSAVAVAATQRNRRRHRDRPATARVAAGREGEFYREALEQLDSAEVRLEYLVHRGGCRTVAPKPITVVRPDSMPSAGGSGPAGGLQRGRRLASPREPGAGGPPACRSHRAAGAAGTVSRSIEEDQVGDLGRRSR